MIEREGKSEIICYEKNPIYDQNLLSACTFDFTDLATIEYYLRLGANPMGAIIFDGEENNLYSGIIEYYLDNEEFRIDRLPLITEILCRYGMDISKPSLSYDDEVCFVNPLWTLGLFEGTEIVKVLKVLLDYAAVDPKSLKLLIGNILDDFDLCFFPIRNEKDAKFVLEIMETEVGPILLLLTAYPDILKKDTYLLSLLDIINNGDYNKMNFKKPYDYNYKAIFTTESFNKYGVQILVTEKCGKDPIWKFLV